jgi:hypothetical protein
LIKVPYWWNRKKESLAATIQQVRPELIKDVIAAEPISYEISNVAKKQLDEKDGMSY